MTAQERQIIEALFQIAEEGPVKISLWHEYQRLLQEPDRMTRLELRIGDLTRSIALLRETTDTSIKHLASHVSHLAMQISIDHQNEP